jgi:hypothetical protein
MDIYIYNPISDIYEEDAKTDSLHKVIISSSIYPKNAESVEEVYISIDLHLLCIEEIGIEMENGETRTSR